MLWKLKLPIFTLLGIWAYHRFLGNTFTETVDYVISWHPLFLNSPRLQQAWSFIKPLGTVESWTSTKRSWGYSLMLTTEHWLTGRWIGNGQLPFFSFFLQVVSLPPFLRSCRIWHFIEKVKFSSMYKSLGHWWINSFDFDWNVPLTNSFDH